MVVYSKNKFMCMQIVQDVDKLVREAQAEIGKAQKWQALYYNMHRREMEIKVGDFVLLEKHWISSWRQKRVAKFGPKFVSKIKVLEVVNNNLVIDVGG